MAASPNDDLNKMLEALKGLQGKLSTMTSSDEWGSTVEYPSEAQNSNPIYVPDECPAHLEECDEDEMAQRGGSCPDDKEAPHPGIYNKRGNRCYTPQSVQRSVAKLKSSDKLTMIQNIRMMVTAAAKLNGKLAGHNSCGEVNSESGPVKGKMKDGPNDPVMKRRRAFCGMMLDVNNKAKCHWDNESKHCGMGEGLTNRFKNLKQGKGKGIRSSLIKETQKDLILDILKGIDVVNNHKKGEVFKMLDDLNDDVFDRLVNSTRDNILLEEADIGVIKALFF